MRAVFSPVVFALVALALIGVTVFRIASAPDRFKARQETARKVCAESGGEWVLVGRDQICRKPGVPGKV